MSRCAYGCGDHERSAFRHDRVSVVSLGSSRKRTSVPTGNGLRVSKHPLAIYGPLRARFSASSSASVAFTLMSVSTPVPSQSVLVIGLIKRPNGTRMKK